MLQLKRFESKLIHIKRTFFQTMMAGMYFCAGEMAERSNAAVLKTVDPKGPGVRIPLSPLFRRENRAKMATVARFIFHATRISQKLNELPN